MATTRRRFTSAFKAKVAIAALKGDRTLAELSAQYGIHQNQISKWKQQLQKNADTLFDGGGIRRQHDGEIEKLHAKIGQLTMEHDFLSKALDR